MDYSKHLTGLAFLSAIALGTCTASTVNNFSDSFITLKPEKNYRRFVLVNKRHNKYIDIMEDLGFEKCITTAWNPEFRPDQRTIPLHDGPFGTKYYWDSASGYFSFCIRSK